MGDPTRRASVLSLTRVTSSCALAARTRIAGTRGASPRSRAATRGVIQPAGASPAASSHSHGWSPKAAMRHSSSSRPWSLDVEAVTPPPGLPRSVRCLAFLGGERAVDERIEGADRRSARTKPRGPVPVVAGVVSLPARRCCLAPGGACAALFLTALLARTTDAVGASAWWTICRTPQRSPPSLLTLLFLEYARSDSVDRPASPPPAPAAPTSRQSLQRIRGQPSGRHGACLGESARRILAGRDDQVRCLSQGTHVC